MSVVAILGAGPIGAATAHRLAERQRVASIRLIDENLDVAAGKALDIQQSGPVLGFGATLTASADALAASGAAVVVVADAIDGGEWRGDEGYALMERLSRAGMQSPVVFTGATHYGLMERCVRDRLLPAHRAIGTAPSALVGAVQALTGLELNLASVELTVVGRPPHFVIGWSAATAAGSLVTDRVAAHHLLRISQALGKLWPPGPHAIGAATAAIVESLIFGGRRLHPALTVLDGELDARTTAVMLPLELGRLRILSHVKPSLSPQEWTELTNAIAGSR